MFARRTCRSGRLSLGGQIVALAIVFGSLTPASAQTWTGAVSGQWGDANNWSPAGLPGAGPNTALTFGSATNTAMSVGSGFGIPFVLNRMTFSAGGPAYTAVGNPLDFRTNSSAVGPRIVMDTDNAVTIGDPLMLTNSLTVNGGGTGILTLNGAISGVGSLSYAGNGTLSLGGSSNTYTGGTFVNSGTLLLSNGSAIQTGRNVTVAAGAVFDTGGFSNTPSSAIGTLTLNGGSFRVPSGNGNYYLNKLVMTGGAVDFAGTSNFGLHFTGSGAGITANDFGTTNWTGGGTSSIINDTASPLPITLGFISTLNVGIILSGGGTNPNFTINGTGSYIRLSNTGNTANISIINSCYLYSNDLSSNVGGGAFGTLGTGIITLAGGGLVYDGGTAISAKPLTLGAASGIYVYTPGANLTMSGVISQSVAGTALSVYGYGVSTLTLTANNSYSGSTSVSYGAVLAIPSLGAAGAGGVNSPLGASSNAAANLNLGSSVPTRGDLLLTGTDAAYVTDRGATVAGLYANGGGGAIGVQNAGTTLTWSGPITGPGSFIKTGAGTLVLGHAANTFAGGAYVEAGRLTLGSGTAIPTGGDVTVSAGAEFNTAGLSNFPGSAVGTLTLNGGRFVVPGGNGNYYLNKLTTGPTGGTVDVTGSSNFWLRFINAGAGIAVAGDSTWVGAAGSRIQNDTADPLTITVNGNSTLDVGLILSNGGINADFIKAGTGTLRLSNTGNAANITCSDGYVSTNDLATDVGGGAFGTLGTGTFTLAYGNLRYNGPSATSAKPITLTGFGRVQVTSGGVNSGANLTLQGAIGESAPGAQFEFVGAFNPASPNTLTLTGLNSYTSATSVSGYGVLAVPTIGNAGAGGVASPIGASSNAAVNLQLGYFGRGTLLLTGTDAAYSTDRGLIVAGSYAPAPSYGFGGAVGVANAATTLTWAGQITDYPGFPGSFIKVGPGTLVIENATNNFSQGTYIEAGRLTLGSATALPTGGAVTVSAGATFSTGGLGNAPATAIGAVTLNGGTLRAAPLTPSTYYYLNRLVTDALGGTVDATGATGFPGLAFVNAGAGITINGNSTWTGPNTFFIGNAVYGVELPITIAPNVMLTSNLSLAAVYLPGQSYPLRVTGGGTLYLTNPAYYGAVVRVNQARLRMDDLTNVNTDYFILTLDAGTLAYGGPTVVSPAAFALSAAGGRVEVVNAGTTLTISGTIAGGGTAPLTKSGPGTLVLGSGGNSFNGLTITDGAVQTANDATLGTGPVAVNAFGTLRYTANTSTARTFALNAGTLEAASGATLTLNGAAVGGGFLRGAGTFALTGGTVLSGVSTATSATINQTGPAAVTNFTNNGQFTVAAGQTLTWSNGTNTSAGRMTVNGTVNATDFVSNGQLNVNPGGTLTHSGSDLYLGGGSVTNVGVYNPTTGMVTPGGMIDIGSRDVIVQGGLLRNNGVVTGTGKLIVDYGGIAKGSGDYDTGGTILRNGGILLAGNSPGLQRNSNLTVIGASTIGGDLNNATGVAGGFASPVNNTTNNSGWSAIEFGNSANTASGLTLQRGAGGAVRWQFRTTLNDGVGDTPGNAANFNAATAYKWVIFRPRTNASAANPIPTLSSDQLNSVATITLLDTAGATLANTNANLNQVLSFDASLFRDPATGTAISPDAGTFSFEFGSDLIGRPETTISLVFTPVPEPGWIVAAAGAGLFGWSRMIRRRSNWRSGRG